MVAALPRSCSCLSCVREGEHDPWCTVHLADHENLEVPPYDCGLREGARRTPELREGARRTPQLTPIRVLCAVDSREAVLQLARRVYGSGELAVDVHDGVARVLRSDAELCSAVAFEGEPLGALERYLRRRLEPPALN